MSKLTINIDNHDRPYTVAEMRKRLAQVLSKLNGDQEVSFSFHAVLENYRPASRNTGAANRRQLSMPAILGAPYELSKPSLDPYTYTSFAGALYKWGWEDHSGLTPTRVYGELARPEND